MRGSGRWRRGLRSRGNGSYIKGGELSWGDQGGCSKMDRRGEGCVRGRGRGRWVSERFMILQSIGYISNDPHPRPDHGMKIYTKTT